MPATPCRAGFFCPGKPLVRHPAPLPPFRPVRLPGNSHAASFFTEESARHPAKTIQPAPNPARKSEKNKKYINEDHLCRLTTRSKIEGAEEFESWIFEEEEWILEKDVATVLGYKNTKVRGY